MNKLKVKKNDQVLVTTGKDRGARGRVLRVLASEGKAIVERVNMIKRHTRPNPNKGIQGGILEREAPLQVSNLRVICPECGTPSRLGRKRLDDAVEEMTALAGQRPVITRAQKSIAAFKLRAGMPIGARVTLRGNRMWEFLDRLMSIALPRVRDFRGVSTKSFDGRGNYTLGIRDQLIFPEIDYAKVDKLKGMNVTIVTTARDDNQARALLKHMGMPFRQ